MQQLLTLWLFHTCPPAPQVVVVQLRQRQRRTAKYSTISTSHIFIPVAIETLGPINELGETFLAQVGKLLSTKSDDPREPFFLFQRISVIIQLFDEIAFRSTFTKELCHDE